MVEWPTLKYSLDEVDAAGRVILNPSVSLVEYERALEIVNNWRAAHRFPLNTLQINLRGRARRVDPRATVAQRLKRLHAIEHKLERFMDWLTLSQMQDVGGCRAILHTTVKADELVRSYKQRPLNHDLIDEDDYIRKPKRSGYRSVHLIYRFHSEQSPAFNGRKIELQVRSRSQHSWATAVEMGGLITGQPLKSGLGDPEWLRFFELMGEDMALREGTPLHGPGMDPRVLTLEIKRLARKLRVQERLEALSLAVRSISSEAKRARNATFIVTLDASTRTLRVETYRKQTEEQQLAFGDLVSRERSIRTQMDRDVILIEAESIKGLEKAYPNYFLDAARFLRDVEAATR